MYLKVGNSIFQKFQIYYHKWFVFYSNSTLLKKYVIQPTLHLYLVKFWNFPSARNFSRTTKLLMFGAWCSRWSPFVFMDNGIIQTISCVSLLITFMSLGSFLACSGTVLMCYISLTEGELKLEPKTWIGFAFLLAETFSMTA